MAAYLVAMMVAQRVEMMVVEWAASTAVRRVEETVES